MSRRFNYNADEIDEEEEEDEEDDDDHEKSEKKRRELFGGCSYKRVKKGVNKRFSQFHTRIKRLSSSSSSSLIKLKSDTIVDDSSSSSSLKGKKKRGKFDCCLCFSKPQTLENCVDDCELGDPNVDYNSLRVLIENNDFYSKECNTLFDD